MTTFFHRIAIVGVGLIGGSWGLALGKRSLTGTRVGCDRPDVLKRATAAGAIDESAEDPAQAVRDADLVVLAAPVGAILDVLPRLRPAVSAAALVTDVGSTKRLICQRAREVFGDQPLFVGGHPLAGKELSGFENADARLFENA
ncbi:MAG: prephenate dehydrogenase/arogenate dehydrogenase family protein, partial [Acidobacteria bacterium]